MSPAPTAATPSRPTLVDYFALLVGGSLSLYLSSLSPILAQPTDEGAAPLVSEFVAFLPGAMRLPEGIVLVGPIFYVGQLVLRRRSPALTSLEWLWVVNWVGLALLAGLAVWDHSGTLPEFLGRFAGTPRKLWYLIFVPSLAVLGAVLGAAGIVRRAPLPWTHTLGLVLLLWPVAPLLGILALGKFV